MPSLQIGWDAKKIEIAEMTMLHVKMSQLTNIR